MHFKLLKTVVVPSHAKYCQTIVQLVKCSHLMNTCWNNVRMSICHGHGHACEHAYTYSRISTVSLNDFVHDSSALICGIMGYAPSVT